MHRMTIGMLAVGALTASGCGSSSTFANKPRPATPVNLTVYINNSRVSVSPGRVGAGPVVLIVTNQASSSETLKILPAGAAATQSLADTGPINPQGTTQVSVNFTSQGDYTIATGSGGSTDAALSTAASIRPATLHVGPARPNASNQLLQP